MVAVCLAGCLSCCGSPLVRVQLCDFGVAHQFPEEARARGLLTKTEGTLAFHAPECCRRTCLCRRHPIPPCRAHTELRPGSDGSDRNLSGDRPVSREFNAYKVDVWALGVTMFCMLFGKLPFPFVTVLDICEKINNDEYAHGGVASIRQNTDCALLQPVR